MDELKLPKNSHIHMVGIGGAGVSGLAAVMAGMGYTVSGSDLRPGPVAERLKSLGITVFAGHDSAYVNGADLVVASAAVPADNPEMGAAKKKGIPIFSRAQMLGKLMCGKTGIAVAGTHGKTTTTAMLAMLLEAAGLDPTVLIGGDLDRLNGNAKLGRSDLFVTEACEAFGSFLELRPSVAVVTNIEADHLDYHGSLEGVMESFRRFLSQIVDGGCAVLGADCPNVRTVSKSIMQRTVTYGLSEVSDCRATEVDAERPDPSFRVVLRGADLGQFVLCIPGLHNVQNALAAITVGSQLGIDPNVMRNALAEFRGAGRRFEVLGTAAGITIVDDYAHHPTEVRATLAASRTWGRRVIVVFQPHLYSRTKLLAEEFAESLRVADEIIVTEIYAAREKPMPGVSGSMIVDLASAGGSSRARFIADKERIPDEIVGILRPRDLVIVMGAGDIRSVGKALLTRLGSRVTLTDLAIERKET